MRPNNESDAQVERKTSGMKAIRSISIRMMLAMSAIAILGALLLVIGVILGSRHELSERGFSPNEVTSGALFHGSLIIDSEKAIIFIILFVAGIIITTGMVAWFLSREEIRPLDQAIRLQRNFVADASHELKTPLAIINARSELIERRLRLGKPIDPLLKELTNDVSRMDIIINDLLLAARGATSPHAVNLSQAITHALESIDVLAEQREVAIHFASPSATVLVLCEETGIERCLVAVLDNAIVHSPHHTNIEVTLHAAQDKAVVTVRDQGTGMEGNPEQWFARFARSDVESEHQGYGLGLALTRDILSRYQGTIRVLSTSSSGTTIEITLRLTVDPTESKGNNK